MYNNTAAVYRPDLAGYVEQASSWENGLIASQVYPVVNVERDGRPLLTMQWHARTGARGSRPGPTARCLAAILPRVGNSAQGSLGVADKAESAGVATSWRPATLETPRPCQS